MDTTTPSGIINVTSSPIPGDSNHGNHSLEAYTVVLSITAHIVSMLFGGASSVVLITAVLTKGNINKHSYLLVLTLFFACCCVNFIFSPMEITDLLMYHLEQKHPTPDFVITKTVVYIFLSALINIIIVLLVLESIIRKANCFGRVMQWPFTASTLALGWSMILVIIMISQVVDVHESSANIYIHKNSEWRQTFLILIVAMCSLLSVTLLILLVQFLKSRTYWEGYRPHFREKKLSLAVPEFLISQSQNDGDDDDEICGYDNVNEPSSSRTPSPSTPKLLSVSSPDSGSIKSTEAMPAIHGLPKSSGNRLGINMAHVLGRRRHTICDSLGATPQPDPLVKAKQYNYVRKFSVDISALQAQLQNPKIFKDAPFQSDIDLAKRAAEDNKAQSKPIQPLKPLDLKLKDQRKDSVKEDTVETPRSAGLSIPPPVIMVSNDDSIPEKDDKDLEANTENHTSNNTVPIIEQHTNNNHQPADSQRPEVPSTLPLIKNDNMDDIASMPTLESAVSAQSDAEASCRLVHLSALTGITFLVMMLPVLLIEAFKYSMSSHSFVNISTCMLAVSTIQTIVYPNVVIGYDKVLRSAVGMLKQKVYGKEIDGEDSYTNRPSHKFADESSSTSHV